MQIGHARGGVPRHGGSGTGHGGAPTGSGERRSRSGQRPAPSRGSRAAALFWAIVASCTTAWGAIPASAVAVGCVVGAGLLGGCKPHPPEEKLSPKETTWAELRAVRRGVHVQHHGDAERAPYARERLTDGAVVKIDEGGLAWLRRDGGSTLLVRGPARLTLRKDTIDVESGKIFAESPQGIVTAIGTPRGALFLSDVRASLDVGGDGAEVYVLDGEVRTKDGRAARSGELLSLSKDGAKVSPAVAWEDWTGGLATTDRTALPAPFGIGTVGARSPGATGAPRSPLAIQRLDVRVTVDGDFASTEVDETFFNPVSETVEGIYQFRAPPGAILERFGVDRLDGISWGYVKEKKAAAAQYQANVYQGSTEDPALLEWRAPGVYQAKLYPIAPGATRRVVVRYTEWLGRSGESGERRLYVFPMAAEGSESSLPHVEELSARIDLSHAGAGEVRSGMQAVRDGDVIVVREHDFVPRADLAIELFDDPTKKPRDPSEIVAYRAPHAPDLLALPPNEREAAKKKVGSEADYVLVPLRDADVPKRTGGLDLLVVVDSSAATDGASLSLARAATRSLLAHLGKDDRVAVLTGDDSLRPLLAGGELFRPANEAAKGEILGALARVEQGGATDLGGMLSDAISRLPNDPSAGRAAAIVYVGDGAPTVGELTLADLRAKLAKANRPARIFALGIGEDANMGILDGLSGGAFAERIGDEHAAAEAALRLFSVADRAVDLGVKVGLGANVERVYPRDLGAIADDESVLVVGRLTGDKPPTEVVITTARGERRAKLKIATLDDHGDLRRRWAMGRLDEMLAENAGHAAIVDLGVRQGVITPVTSLYVPTTNEMTSDDRANIDRTLRRSHEHDGKAKLEARNGRDDDLDEQPKKPGFFDSLSKKDSEAEPSAIAQGQKEGGTGTRAKGEEGTMGAPHATDGTAAATASPVAATPAAPGPAPAASGPAPAEPAPPRGGWGGDGGEREEKRVPAQAPQPSPASETVDAPARPRMQSPPKTAEAPVLDPAPAARPDEVADNKGSGGAKGGLGVTGTGRGGGGTGYGTGLGGQAPGGDKQALCNPGDPLCDASGEVGGRGRLGNEAQDFGMIGLLDERSTFRSGDVTIIIGDDPGRHIKPCGDAAKLPFEERLTLWRERLGKIGGSPNAAANVYRRALADCEAPTPRERTALLHMMLDFIPATSARVDLWRIMQSDLGAADVLYRGILARVTTPAQMRELSAALGLVTVEPSVLDKTLKEAKDPADKVVKLRALSALFPNDLSLALVLLDAIEDAGDTGAARGLSRQLRSRPDADARVRTAVGELFLRLADEDADGAQKEADALEARRAFGEIVEFSPEDPVARRRLGDLLRAHGFFEEASRQYETLAKLTPDDPSVALLLAACADGLGRIEEAVRWTEKGGAAGAPDASQGPFATARAFAATYLAWGKLAARADHDQKTLDALSARLARVLSSAGQQPREGQVRVTLTWAHPELHPVLWSNALGAPMPAPEGDVTLGIAQVMLPDKPGQMVEIRLEPQDLDRARRLGAKAVLTAVFGENKDTEVVVRREIVFAKGDPATKKLHVEGGKVEDAGGDR